MHVPLTLGAREGRPDYGKVTINPEEVRGGPEKAGAIVGWGLGEGCAGVFLRLLSSRTLVLSARGPDDAAA